MPSRWHRPSESGLDLLSSAPLLATAAFAAGVLNASGYLDVDTGGVLNGRFLAELKVRAGNLPLVLSGKVGEPVLRAAR